MNSQNILKFYGSRLDLKLDHSEFYDYELGKTDLDYNSDVLDLTKQITYNTLKINTSLSGLSCSRNLILLNEFNNSINDSSYLYSGITLNLNYGNFISYFGSTYNDTILNNDIYTFTGITNEIHYFKIDEFNNSTLPLFSYNTDLLGDDIVIDEIFNSEDTIISGFTKQVIQCANDLDNSLNCCPITPKLNSKPWAYKFNTGIGVGNCDPIISRRPEKGWTLDFIFNRESLDWNQGGVFYYLGVRGENNNRQYSDNNLSFQFTSDGKISWFAHHYSGFCGNDGYEEVFYLSSGITPLLCTIDEEKDFNVTIVFDRYKKYQDCDLENNGGWNDLIVSPTLNTSINEWLSGDTESYTYTEILNKKWADERQRRLGTLKIYLNGRPIYKIDDWEEVIPSERGRQPFIQSWGGGTGLMNNVHDGVSCFNIKSIKYYEEPLDFIHVRHNFLTRINQYDFDICGDECFDSVIGLIASTPTPTPTSTETPTPTPTPTPTFDCLIELTNECPTYFSRFVDNNLYFKNTGDTYNLISSYILDCSVRQIAMDDSRLFFVDGCSKYNEYSYNVTSEGCFNLTFVKDWEIWNDYPNTPNAASALSLYDENTLIVGENQSSISQTGSTLYLYDLTTSNLTKWLELGGGAQLGNVYYNTGNTQMILSYTIANSNLGYFDLYSGSTNPQLIAQIPTVNTNAGSNLYFNGNTPISVNPAGVQYVLDFESSTITMIRKQNGVPILYIDYDNLNTFASLGSIVNASSCYNFNIITTI